MDDKELKNTDANENEKVTPKVDTKEETTNAETSPSESMESSKVEENKSLETNPEAPVINIPESIDTKEEVKAQNQTLNPATDFSSIFGVASEEQAPEVKIEAKKEPEPAQELAPEVKVAENVEVPKTQEPKFNKDQFNSEEKLLYEIKPEKEGNPLVVLFFFIFLIAFIIFLPSLVKVANFNFTQNRTNTNNNEPEQSEFYELGSTSVRVKMDNLELNNFVKSSEDDEYYLIFTLTNTASEPYMFNKKYYITLYDGESIVGYALIHSYDIVAAYGAREVKLVINENSYQRANQFKVEEIVASRYPKVATTEVDGEYNVLTCTHLNDEMKYYFSNDALVKIKETYKELQSNSKNYDANKDTYRNLSNKYKQIQNFTSDFIETNTDFTMINNVELKDIPDKTLTDLKVYRYFRYSEDIKTVAFELGAQGYTCS